MCRGVTNILNIVPQNRPTILIIGVFTLKTDTTYLPAFWVLFREIRYSDWWVFIQWRISGGGVHGGICPTPSRRLCPALAPTSQKKKMTKISHFRQNLGFWPPWESHDAPPQKKKFWCRHFFHQRWMSPNYVNWVYLEQIMVKSTQFE